MNGWLTAFFCYLVFITTKLNFAQGQLYHVLSNVTNERNADLTQFFKQNNNKSNNNSISNRKRLSCDVSKTKYFLKNCLKKPEFRLDKGFLLTYLLHLKLCQLMTGYPWLDRECANPLHDLTDYHKTSYDKICNPAKYASICRLTPKNPNQQPSAIIRSWLKHHNFSYDESYDKKLIETPDINKTAESLTPLKYMACDAIESYFAVLSEQVLLEGFANDTQSSFPFYNVQYTEWFVKDYAFCEEIGCAVSRKKYASLFLSYRDCIPERCHLANVIAMVTDGLIAIFIIVANFLILVVFFRSSVMKNIPGYFKLSLAFADLGIGLIIMPSVIYNRFRFVYIPLPYRYDGILFGLTDYFNQNYIKAISFFAVLFLFVSIFTLCAASAERYLAISRPFKYRAGKYFTNKKTGVILLLIWLTGVALSMMSVFFGSVYSVVGSDLILGASHAAFAFYEISFGFAMIVLMILNVALFLNIRAQNRKEAIINGKKRSNIMLAISDQTVPQFNFVTKSTSTKNSETEKCSDSCQSKRNSPTLKLREK